MAVWHGRHGSEGFVGVHFSPLFVPLSLHCLTLTSDSQFAALPLTLTDLGINGIEDIVELECCHKDHGVGHGAVQGILLGRHAEVDEHLQPRRPYKDGTVHFLTRLMTHPIQPWYTEGWNANDIHACEPSR